MEGARHGRPVHVAFIKHLLVDSCISTPIASAFRIGMDPVFSAESDPILNRSDSEPNPNWAGKSEPNPDLAWRNRTEPEPGPRQTEPNPNPAPPEPIHIDSEPRRSHPNPGRRLGYYACALIEAIRPKRPFFSAASHLLSRGDVGGAEGPRPRYGRGKRARLTKHGKKSCPRPGLKDSQPVEGRSSSPKKLG